MKHRALICTLLLAAFLAFGTPAWATNVKICHVPPGNPSNFHTIIISVIALLSHLAHGDLLGPCFEHCDQLCDDGNACTIDACDATGHCKATHPPVNCNDSNLCTIDSCNPATGCASTPKTCLDGSLCTVDTCDPLTGNCAFPPIACPTGQTCNPGNGSCEGNACDPSSCVNGTCQPGGGCTCEPGWTGTNCDTDIDECAIVPSVCPPEFNHCTNFPGTYGCSYS